MIRGDTVRFSAYTIRPGALKALHAPLRKTRVAVVTGEKSWDAAQSGLPQLEIVCVLRYGGECTMDAIHAAAEACAEAGADVVLGIGGGKALDVAKAAAEMTGMPVYTVPTIAATCAAVTALSIVYHADGKLDCFLPLKAPPVHAFLDTALLAAAPDRYFRAGLADCMGKHLECTLSTRGERLNYVNSLGVEISRSIFRPLLQTGAQAYRDAANGQPTHAFADALQRMIISTGMTSLLVDEENNGAIAHSVCYGLGALPGVEHRLLHGELVGYGCLVQLAADGDEETLLALRDFLLAIDSPVSLRAMEIPDDPAYLAPAIAEILKGPDLRHLPYAVTAEMLQGAMRRVEAL